MTQQTEGVQQKAVKDLIAAGDHGVDQINENSQEDALNISDIETLKQTHMNASSYYDKAFVNLTPHQKDSMPDKTFPHFFVGGDPSQRHQNGTTSPSIGGMAVNILDTNISDEDINRNESVISSPQKPKAKLIIRKTNQNWKQSPYLLQKKGNKKDQGNTIKTGSFNTSHSQYFEKTNSTQFKPMYYMKKDSLRNNPKQDDMLKIRNITLQPHERPILFEEIKKQQDQQLQEIKDKISRLALNDRNAEMNASNPDLADINTENDYKQYAFHNRKKNSIAVKNNLRIDISQVNELTLENTVTHEAGQKSRDFTLQASFRKEMETSIDQKDHKYLTVNTTSRNQYPKFKPTLDNVEQIDELKQTYHNQGTKSTKMQRLTEENMNSETSQSFIFKNKYHNQGIQSDVKSTGTLNNSKMKIQRGADLIITETEEIASLPGMPQSINSNYRGTQQAPQKQPKFSKNSKMGQTLQQNTKNSFIEKQNQKQQKFKQRFSSSIGQISSTIDKQRERFNQTTKMISLKNELERENRSKQKDVKPIQEFILPKNLDKISLNYQFTSSNRMNHISNVKTQKEHQKMQLQTAMYEQHKNFENRDELIQIIKNATIEKVPPHVQKFDQEYTGLGIRSKSNLGQYKFSLEKSEPTSVVTANRVSGLHDRKSGLHDRKSTLRDENQSQVDEIFYIKNKVSQEALLVQRPSPKNKVGVEQSKQLLPKINQRNTDNQSPKDDSISENDEPSSPSASINPQNGNNIFQKKISQPIGGYGQSTRELNSPIPEMTESGAGFNKAPNSNLITDPQSHKSKESHNQPKIDFNLAELVRLEEASRSGEFALKFDIFEKATLPKNSNIQLQRQTFQSQHSSKLSKDDTQSLNSNLNLLYAHASVYNHKMRQQLKSNLQIIDNIPVPNKLRNNITPSRTFAPSVIKINKNGTRREASVQPPPRLVQEMEVDVSEILRNKGNNQPKASQLFQSPQNSSFIPSGFNLTSIQPQFQTFQKKRINDRRNTLQSKLIQDEDIIEKDIRQFKNNRLLF